MNFVPPFESAFFLAIGFKDNIKAQKLLQAYPTININLCNHATNIPYALTACRNHDNAEMLELLLNRGFILTPYLRQEFIYALKNNKPALIKLLLKHGALNYLTTHEQVSSFITLIKQLDPYTPEEQQECLELFASSKFTIATDQTRTLLFTLLSEYLTLSNLQSYSTRLVPNTLEHSLQKTRIWSTILCGLTLLEKHGIDLKIKQPDYNALMQTLAYKGCTELIIYLLHKTTMIDTHTIHEILAAARENIPDKQASEFIDTLLVNMIPLEDSERGKAIKHALVNFLLEHWTKSNNKSVVKLLRRFTLVQRLFISCIPPEVAYKIAQYDTDSFHNQILDTLPSYEQVQKFIAQKTREYASLTL